ncbi:MAG: methionyl-tRNA formyltransferase [Clostridia bacterium]|nr:methionyl-tRNA formyltransferase [Clostridia bacterium]
MRVIYMGTPDFSVLPLRRIAERHEVVLAVTQPDKPKGRGYKMLPTPVKECAQSLGIEVYQPEKINDEAVIEYLRSFEADIIVVAAYGKKLPVSILEMPKYKCINIHASLLPKYRGAAPINRAIMNGDKTGGVTIMNMAEGMDTGDIVLQRSFDISTMTAGEYHDRLSEVGSDAVLEAMELIESGRACPVKQNDDEATHAAKITKEECLVEFDMNATAAYNKIRGLSPVPCAYIVLNGKRIKIVECELSCDEGESGKVLCADKNGIKIAFDGGSIVLKRIRPEGSGEMTAWAYVLGHEAEFR